MAVTQQLDTLDVLASEPESQLAIDRQHSEVVGPIFSFQHPNPALFRRASELLDRSTSLHRVLFTNDQDLLRIAAARQQRGTPFAGVIYAPQTSPLARVLPDLELCALACEPEDFADGVTYLRFP